MYNMNFKQNLFCPNFEPTTQNLAGSLEMTRRRLKTSGQGDR